MDLSPVSEWMIAGVSMKDTKSPLPRFPVREFISCLWVWVTLPKPWTSTSHPKVPVNVYQGKLLDSISRCCFWKLSEQEALFVTSGPVNVMNVVDGAM